MQRDTQGKFALKNAQRRSVRSLRLTDATWSALGALAESKSLTRADLLEQMFGSNNNDQPSNTRISKTAPPSNTRQKEACQPSNTQYDEEIRQLRAEVAHLRSENAIEPVRELHLASEFEAFQKHVLSSLKLGKQAPGYKAAKLALNQSNLLNCCALKLDRPLINLCDS